MPSSLPITHLTLYKHGVGFFQRQGRFDGDEVALTFRSEDMNDVLKSLIALDHGPGQVLGVDYATPQTREQRLAGNSIRLADDRSLRDLLVNLRGRAVRLLLDQDETLEGTLLGLDELPDRQAVAESPVSLLVGEDDVHAVPLGRLQGVQLRDEKAAADLRFFLETARSQDDFRTVTIRLTAGEHDLSVSYLSPAPTWRVSYRLVADEDDDRALLLGWGIFDNRLEEDLDQISLSLVAGMPISFIYNLYEPKTPQRPEVEDEERVAAGPVEFSGAAPQAEEMREMAMKAAPAPRAMAAAAPSRRALAADALQEAASVDVQAASLGALFQYNVGASVSVRRGQSAMVPIIATRIPARKDLLYNGATLPAHPVASLRLQNESELTLERGPTTVVQDDEYVGEAIVPFTAPGSEFVVPYAVELNVNIREQSGASSELHALHVQGAMLIIEHWDIRWRELQLNNDDGEAKTVLVEHPRDVRYELFDSPSPAEKSEEHLRFAVDLAARAEATLRISQRRLVSRRETLQRQSYENLQRYLRKNLIDRRTHEALAAILRLWEEVARLGRRLEKLDEERQKIFQSQKQIQGNMAALANSGREGELRARYVRELETGEDRLVAIKQEERKHNAEIKRLEEEIERRMQDLDTS